MVVRRLAWSRPGFESGSTPHRADICGEMEMGENVLDRYLKHKNLEPLVIWHEQVFNSGDLVWRLSPYLCFVCNGWTSNTCKLFFSTSFNMSLSLIFSRHFGIGLYCTVLCSFTYKILKGICFFIIAVQCYRSFLINLVWQVSFCSPKSTVMHWWISWTAFCLPRWGGEFLLDVSTKSAVVELKVFIVQLSELNWLRLNWRIFSSYPFCGFLLPTRCHI